MYLISKTKLLFIQSLFIVLLINQLCLICANTFLSCEAGQGESFSSDGCTKCTCVNGETFCETEANCKQNVVLLDKRANDPCPYGKYFHNGEKWCGCKNGITSCITRGG